MSWQDTAITLDAQIAHLEHRLYDLRAKRNDITPFYRLPHETLEYILLLVQPESWGDPYVGTYHRGSQWATCGVKLVQAMGICRRLRDAALSSTALWSNVDLDHKNFQWAELCLKRASNHTLNLGGSVRHMWDLRTQHFLQLFARATSVRVTIRPLLVSEEGIYDDEHTDALDALAQSCLCKPQQLLQSLEIYDEHRVAALEWDIFVFDGAKFLGGSGINLTHLLLDKVHFDTVPFMPLPRRLIIYQMHNSLACVELRALLIQTPSLATLRIEDPGQPIDLPQLSDLSLSGTIAQAGQILQLFLPTQVMLNFELAMPDETHGYINPQYFMEHLPLLSHRIQTRVAHQLASVSHNHALECKIEGSEYSGGVKILEIDIVEAIPSPAGPRYMQSVRLLCPIAANISNLVCHAVNVEIVHRHSMSHLVLDLVGSRLLSTLVAVNVNVNVEIPFHKLFRDPPEPHETEFERVLSTRAKDQGSPVPLLIMRYYGPVEDQHWLSFPSLEVRSAAESRWKTANWVSQVRWDDWEEN